MSGIDDAASVAIHGIIKSIMFSHDALWYQILQGPIAILGGLGFGVLWGWLAKYVPEKGDVSTLNFTRFYYIDNTTRSMISRIDRLSRLPYLRDRYSRSISTLL